MPSQQKSLSGLDGITASARYTVKWGNFDQRGNFDRSGSFVKLAPVPIQERLFVASALMEIND